MRTLAFLSLAAFVAVPGLAAAKTYDFEAHDVYFTLAGATAQDPTISVEAGESVTINLVQKGVQPHNWVVDGITGAKAPATGFLTTPDQTGNATFTAPASGEFSYYCQAHPTDMKGTFRVASADAGNTDDGNTDDGAASGDDKDTPSVGLVGLLAVLGAVAVAATRRRA